MVKNVIMINIFMSANTDDNHDKYEIIISFRFQGRFFAPERKLKKPDS